MKIIRSLSLAAASLLVCTGSFTSHAASFDDIQLWAGTGDNRAALVIDWNDGREAESMVWGFRWDGVATGLDMLLAVVSADSRLFAHLGTYVWGTAVQGLGYDLNGNGSFAVTPSLSFDGFGLALSANPDDARSAVEAGDRFVEGWNFGFWAYYTRADGQDSWDSSWVGAQDRILANGSWDGYSFAADFDGPAPGVPIAAPIPEPSALVLFLLGGGWIVFRRVCSK